MNMLPAECVVSFHTPAAAMMNLRREMVQDGLLDSSTGENVGENLDEDGNPIIEELDENGNPIVIQNQNEDGQDGDNNTTEGQTAEQVLKKRRFIRCLIHNSSSICS